MNNKIQSIFDRNLNIESYEEFINYIKSTKRDHNKEYKFVNEIYKSLEEMALNGVLEVIENHITPFIDAWDSLIDGNINQEENKYKKREIEYFIEKVLIYSKGKDESIENQFNKFKEFIIKGDIDSYMTPEQSCFDCGEVLIIKFKNWKANIYEFKEINDIDEFKNQYPNERISKIFGDVMGYFPLEKCFKEYVQVKEVEFKTGDLIITDWIKIKEFTNSVEVNGNIHHFNVNSSKGRNEQIEHYLKQGFISINSSSMIDILSIKKDEKNSLDGLIFGKNKQDEDGNETKIRKDLLKREKSLYNDYRGITIIEKEKLEEILLEQMKDIKKVKEVIKDFLNDKNSEILKKKINPGKYTLVYNVSNNYLSDLLFPFNLDEIKPLIFLYDKNLGPNLENNEGKNLDNKSIPKL